MQTSNPINQWLKKYGDPETERFVDVSLAIIEKVRLAMEEKGRRFIAHINHTRGQYGPEYPTLFGVPSSGSSSSL